MGWKPAASCEIAEPKVKLPFGNEEDIRLLPEAGAHMMRGTPTAIRLSLELAGTFVPAQSCNCFVMGIFRYIRNAKGIPPASRETALWKER